MTQRPQMQKPPPCLLRAESIHSRCRGYIILYIYNMYVRSNFGSRRPSLTAFAWPRRNRRSEVLRAESMSGLDGNRELGAVFSPCTCCSYWGHFGITLPLVYLTRAPGVPHQGNGSHGRRVTVLNAVGVRGQDGNREVGDGLRCWWADRLE